MWRSAISNPQGQHHHDNVIMTLSATRYRFSEFTLMSVDEAVAKLE
jgi:hypothetical protein